MIIGEKLIRVEGMLNKRKRQPAQCFSKVSFEDLNCTLKKRKPGITAVDYLYALMPLRGFQTKDGQLDTVRFYKHARIEPSVWSTFTSNTHSPSKETLLKIVIAAKMTEQEAREFLSLAGSGFGYGDFRDQVILSCIELQYYEIEDVYTILEFYGAEIINGKRRFRNIYKDA